MEVTADDRKRTQADCSLSGERANTNLMPEAAARQKGPDRSLCGVISLGFDVFCHRVEM